MAKWVEQATQDAGLDRIAACTEMYFCVGQPSDRADAIARRVHAGSITMAGGDFVKSGTTDRVLTVAGKTINANASGLLADHIALCTGTALRYVTTAPVQTTNNGAPVASAAFTVTASALA